MAVATRRRRQGSLVHKTVRTTLKSADVDQLVVPVVRWLSAKESIITLRACQGDPVCRDKVTVAAWYDARPYVAFLCLNRDELRRTVLVLKPWADVEVHFDEGRDVFVYVARFTTQESLIEMNTSLDSL